MDVAIIVTIAALFVLIAVIMLKGRSGRQAAREDEQGEARVISEKGKAQHEESMRRQAGVRAAHAERASDAGSDTDE